MHMHTPHTHTLTPPHTHILTPPHTHTQYAEIKRTIQRIIEDMYSTLGTPADYALREQEWRHRLLEIEHRLGSFQQSRFQPVSSPESSQVRQSVDVVRGKEFLVYVCNTASKCVCVCVCVVCYDISKCMRACNVCITMHVGGGLLRGGNIVCACI